VRRTLQPRFSPDPPPFCRSPLLRQISIVPNSSRHLTSPFSSRSAIPAQVFSYLLSSSRCSKANPLPSSNPSRQLFLLSLQSLHRVRNPYTAFPLLSDTLTPLFFGTPTIVSLAGKLLSFFDFRVPHNSFPSSSPVPPCLPLFRSLGSVFIFQQLV